MGHAELTLHDQAAARQISLNEYWMPFTPNRDFKSDPKMVVRAEGMYYWNDRGDKLIDASSGLFCCAAGHGRKEIADAVQRTTAAARLHRAVPARPPEAVRARDAHGRAHARRPQPHLLRQLGSEAVDTAMKVALAYHQARGRAAHHVRVARARLSRRQFRRRLAVRHRPQPAQVRPASARRRAHARTRTCRRTCFTRGQGAHGVELADDLQADRRPLRRREHRRRASSSRSPARPAASCRRRAISSACARSATSTASCSCSTRSSAASAAPARPFAAQSFGVTPDIMTMAKATHQRRPADGCGRGHQRRIHDTVMGAAQDGADRVLPRLYVFRPSRGRARRHRHARHLQERRVVRAARDLSPYFLDAMFSLQGEGRGHRHPRLRHDAAIDVAEPRRTRHRGHVLQKKLFDNGLHLKTTGDCAIVAPPLIAEKAHVDTIAEILRKTLRTL